MIITMNLNRNGTRASVFDSKQYHVSLTVDGQQMLDENIHDTLISAKAMAYDLVRMTTLKMMKDYQYFGLKSHYVIDNLTDEHFVPGAMRYVASKYTTSANILLSIVCS